MAGHWNCQVSDTPGYVYVLQNPAWVGWVKVGHVRWRGDNATSSVVMASRISNLNVSDPRKAFETTYTSYAACVLTAERYAHALLVVNHRRGAGEWFHCPLGEAQRIVESACSAARKRPESRSHHFGISLEEERVRVAQNDTEKILQEIADIEVKRLRLPEVTETARAAQEVIRGLLEQMAMSDDRMEAAAKAVLRRLAALEDSE
jgi:hypothetical protein